MAKGRRKGSRNKGYFYRTGRGWYAKDAGGLFVPLKDEQGQRLRDKDTPDAILRESHARFVLTAPERTSDLTLWELAKHYLSHVERTNGADTTREKRADLLFDLCTGFGCKWRGSDEQPDDDKRIHNGCGKFAAEQLRPFHLLAWLDAHSGWGAGTSRLALQAVKRMMNFGVENGLIEKNPIRGMDVPKAGARVTCVSPEQEQALLLEARRPLWEAITVLIRTGMRPAEFAKLTAAHVHAQGQRMEFRFRANEIKTRKARIVRVADPEIIGLVRQHLERKGPIFRNTTGGPWVVKSLSRAFLRAKNRAEAKGVEFDPDCCLYSCRHTYAKRVLTGYWSGRPVTIEILALLMGNTPQVCRDNYLQWCDSYVQPLWDAVSVAANPGNQTHL